MTYRRAILAAVLVYITLDLALPAMPGAFVFEPADSVESVQHNRGRAGVERVVLPALAREALVVRQPRLGISEGTGRPRQVERRPHPVISWLRRPSGDAPSPSEDSH